MNSHRRLYGGAMKTARLHADALSAVHEQSAASY
jgi:hypothetical protein